MFYFLDHCPSPHADGHHILPAIVLSELNQLSTVPFIPPLSTPFFCPVFMVSRYCKDSQKNCKTVRLSAIVAWSYISSSILLTSLWVHRFTRLSVRFHKSGSRCLPNYISLILRRLQLGRQCLPNYPLLWKQSLCWLPTHSCFSTNCRSLILLL